LQNMVTVPAFVPGKCLRNAPFGVESPRERPVPEERRPGMAIRIRNGRYVADFYTPDGRRVRKSLSSARNLRQAKRMLKELMASASKHAPDSPEATGTQEMIPPFPASATTPGSPAGFPWPVPLVQPGPGNVPGTAPPRPQGAPPGAVPGGPFPGWGWGVPAGAGWGYGFGWAGPGVVPLAPIVNSYLRFQETSRSPRNRRRVEEALRRFFERTGCRFACEVTPDVVHSYMERRRREVSARTVNLELAVLRAMFNWAVKNRMLDVNPVAGVSMIREGEEKKLPRCLSEEEVRRLLEAAEGTVYRDIILVFLNTGMRRSEMGFLRWEDVDFERGVIRLRSHEERRLKTHQERVIPMNETTREILQRWRRKTGRSKYVFATPRGKPRVNNISREVKRIAEKAGVKGVSPHVFRHTFASELVRKGEDISRVQELLGHSTITTTQIYLHASTADLQKAVEKLRFQ